MNKAQLQEAEMIAREEMVAGKKYETDEMPISREEARALSAKGVLRCVGVLYPNAQRPCEIFCLRGDDNE